MVNKVMQSSSMESQQQFMWDTQAPGSVSMKIQQLLIPASSALAT